jgi:plasmid stabilization system protein ParE
MLAVTPEAGALYPHRRVQGVRRAVLPRSRYLVYYVYERALGEVAVLALQSALRGRGPRLRRG